MISDAQLESGTDDQQQELKVRVRHVDLLRLVEYPRREEPILPGEPVPFEVLLPDGELVVKVEMEHPPAFRVETKV
jgi:hypothetical protein